MLFVDPKAACSSESAGAMHALAFLVGAGEAARDVISVKRPG